MPEPESTMPRRRYTAVLATQDDGETWSVVLRSTTGDLSPMHLHATRAGSVADALARVTAWLEDAEARACAAS